MFPVESTATSSGYLSCTTLNESGHVSSAPLSIRTQAGLTRKHECVEETVGKAVSGLVLSLCLGDALRQSDRLIWMCLLIAIYDDIRDHSQLACLNLEVAHGEAILRVTLDECGLVRRS